MGRKVGVVITLVGFCVPLASLFFVKGYHPKLGLLGSISRMKIVLRESEYIKYPSPRIEPTKERAGKKKVTSSGRFSDALLRQESAERERKSEISIPYRYIGSGGIVLIFVGIGLIVLYKPRKAS